MDQIKNISTPRPGIKGVGCLDGSRRFAYGCAASQIDSLPTELISAIFVCCLPADSTVKQPNKSEAPILLCHVCQKWRQVAFDTQELWSNLHVRINILTFLKKVKGSVLERGRFVSPKSQDFLDWWAAKLVTNSPSHPFTLSINQPIDTGGFYHSDCYALQTTYHECDIETDEYAEFFSGHLVTSAQNLSLSLKEDDFRMLCSTSLAEFLRLEYLTLHTLVDTIIRHREWHHFPSAPQLRRLHLTSAGSRLLSTLPGAQLTHFCISTTISQITFRHVLTVVCPNLLYGAFSLFPPWRDDLDENLTIRPTCIANVRQLVLSGPIQLSAVFVQFFTGFCFQSLSSLRLQFARHYHDSEADISTLLDVFRATPNIVELHLAAQLFCLPDTHEGMDYGTHTSLGKILLKLKILRLEMTNAVNGTTNEYFQRLIQSNFFRPSTGHSGRVEIVFQTPLSWDGAEEKENSATSQTTSSAAFGSMANNTVGPAGLFASMENAAERSLLADLQAYISAERHTLPCDIVFRQSSDLRHGWSQISKNLSRWEEAMAFYETI
jgi:hypothetical protein